MSPLTVAFVTSKVDPEDVVVEKENVPTLVKPPPETLEEVMLDLLKVKVWLTELSAAFNWVKLPFVAKVKLAAVITAVEITNRIGNVFFTFNLLVAFLKVYPFINKSGEPNSFV